VRLLIMIYALVILTGGVTQVLVRMQDGGCARVLEWVR